MDFFDKLGATISSASKDVSQKAKDLSGTAKLSMDIKAKEDLIQKQYTELGKAYYMAHKDDAEAEGMSFITAIRCAEQEIARMQDEIMKIKGAVKCPKCGKQLPEGTVFCGNCGTKLEAAAPQAAAASQTYTQAAPSPMPAAAPAQAAPTQGEVSSAPSQVTPEMTEE